VRPRLTFRNKLFFKVRNCWPLAQTPSWKQPLVGCSPLLIQYVHSYPAYLQAVWNIILQLIHLPFFSLIPEICCFASSKNCLISRSYSLLRELVYTFVSAVYALRSMALHQCINSVYTSSSRCIELCFGKVKSLAWKLRVSPASLP